MTDHRDSISQNLRQFTTAPLREAALREDRLKIWNPAVLLESWTVENLLADHSSTPFNPDVANAFFRAGEHRMRRHRGSLPQAARRARRAERARQIEIWGRGIQRIFEACQNAGAPAPIIDYKPNDLWFEFPFSPEYLEAIATTSQGEAQSEAPVTDPVDRIVLALASSELAPSALWERLGLKHRPTFRENYLRPALAQGLIEPTLPEKPNSRLQKYRLTEKGRAWLSKSQA